MEQETSVEKQTILGVQVSTTSYSEVGRQVISWARSGQSRQIYAANVHMLMEAYDSRDFRNLLNQADMVTPDGMPLVWMLRLKGCHNQKRVYGPTLMLHVVEMAAREQIPVGFYGTNAPTLKKLMMSLGQRFPGLNVVYTFSPPFRALDDQESAQITADINRSGARILFVGLGCPKQENWIGQHRGRISAVMLGVGAAFNFYAGNKPQAPSWMQGAGLEWLFRLFIEPRRLWWRYLYHNPRFVVLAGLDLFKFSFRSKA